MTTPLRYVITDKMQGVKGEDDGSLLSVNDRVRIPKTTQQFAVMTYRLFYIKSPMHAIALYTACNKNVMPKAHHAPPRRRNIA